MKNHDDHFLTSLLQYHTRLIDQQFVDNIINNIKAKNTFRLKLIFSAFLLAFIVTTPLIISLDKELNITHLLTSFSPYIITSFLLLALGFVAWLTSESF